MDTVEPLRFIASFVFILSLIGMMAWVLKRYAHRLHGMPAASGKEQGRVQIVETRYLDPKRRLVLIRRDNREHLLLLADGRELVIESDIKHAMMSPPQPYEMIDTGT